MRYIAKANFIDGKDNRGRPIHFKAGDFYEGERGEEFLKAGLVESEAEKLGRDEAEVEKKILACEAELSALQGRLQDLRGKSRPSEPASDESGASGEAAAVEAEAGDPVPPPGLKGKALEKWKKENGLA